MAEQPHGSASESRGGGIPGAERHSLARQVSHLHAGPGSRKQRPSRSDVGYRATTVAPHQPFVRQGAACSHRGKIGVAPRKGRSSASQTALRPGCRPLYAEWNTPIPRIHASSASAVAAPFISAALRRGPVVRQGACDERNERTQGLGVSTVDSAVTQTNER